MRGSIILWLLGWCGSAFAGQGTTTTLTITAGATPVTTVQSGSAVVLTATVKVGSTPLTNGQVKFCNAAAAHCMDENLLGLAQITPAGTATYTFFPAPGSHSYLAMFVPEVGLSASTSSAVALTVTGGHSVSSAVTSSGSAGNYTLTDTVTGSFAAFPTGMVTFQEASNGNLPLGMAALGPVSSNFATTNSTVATTESPSSIQAADLNGDGYPDLIVGNFSANLQVALNNHAGGFNVNTQTYYGGGYPSGMAVGDFNRDGNMDVAVADVFGNSLTILLGDGTGTLNAQATTYTVANPQDVQVGDFNGDGFLDLAVTSYNDTEVILLKGNGDGTFGTFPVISLPTAPVASVVGDFNGDGVADLAVALPSLREIAVYLGNGNGTFTAGATLTGSVYPNGLVAGDFNSDGKLDLAVADSSGPAPLVYLGDGTGNFGAAKQIAVPSGGQAFFLSAGDFNGDGIPDLAGPIFNNDQASFYLGDGTGNFVLTTSPAAGVEPYRSVAADFNQDGLADLALVNENINYAPSPSTSVYVSNAGSTATASAVSTGVSLPGSGTIQVDASSAGDGNYVSTVSPQTGLMGTPVATALSVAATPSGGSYAGQQVVLTATLSPYNDANLTTDGNLVTFYSGTTSLGKGTLSSGVATLNTTALPAGTNTLSAKFLGNTNFAASTASGISYYVAAQAPLVLSGTAASMAIGNYNGLTITVTNPSGTAAVDGLQIAVTLPPGLYTSAPTVAGNTCGGSISTPGVPMNESPLLTGGSLSAGESCQLVLTKVVGSVLGVQNFSVAASGNGGFSASTSGSTKVLPGVWIVNSNQTLSEFATDGTVVSPSGGYSGIGGPTAGLAIEEGGNVYSLHQSLLEITGFGTVAETSNPGAGGLDQPTGLAIDGADQVWVSNNDGSISAFSSPLTPKTSVGSPSNATSTTGGVSIDSSGNVWVTDTSENAVTEFLGAAVPTQVIAASTAATSEGSRP